MRASAFPRRCYPLSVRFPSYRFFFVTAVGLGLVVFACSSDDPDDWSYDGPRSACSTGVAHDDLNASFPQAPLDQRWSDAPECVARCGEQKKSVGHYGITWTVSALPSGSCSYDGEVCSMGAVRTRECPDGRTVACSLTGYACRCEDGNWRCYSGPQGASACLCSVPVPVDGGADSGLDGGERADSGDASDAADE